MCSKPSVILVALTALLVAGAPARAQEELPPEAPPPPPPPAYAYPPPVYAPPPLVAPPPRVHYELRPRYGLVSSGAVLFGVTWAVTATVAYIGNEGWLAVPIAGPVIELARCSTCGTDAGARTLYLFGILDGLAQAAGIAMVIAGLTTHHRVAVYDTPRLSLVPTPLRGGAGLAALGRF
jgi:hypothetical protein